MRRGSAEQMAKEKKIAIATSIRICGLHVRFVAFTLLKIINTY